MNTEQSSPEESPTRYMLPEQVDEGEGKGLVDYSLNEYSPARYPIATNKKDEGEGYSNTDYSCGPHSPASYRFSKKKKRKAQNKDSKKKKKAKTGKTVQFHSKVILKTMHGKKTDLTEIELNQEEEYAKRHSDFTVKRARQKQWMKLHHQQRPMTPKRIKIQNIIQRENGNA